MDLLWCKSGIRGWFGVKDEICVDRSFSSIIYSLEIDLEFLKVSVDVFRVCGFIVIGCLFEF